MTMHRIASTILLAIALSACGGEPPATTTEAPPVAEVTSKPLPGDSPGKPSVPVSLAYEFLQAPAVGQPLTVRLEVSGGADVVAMDLAVNTRGALTLSKNTPATAPLKAASTGAPGAMTQDIVVTPSDEGRSYVNVQVSGTWEGEPFTKAMSIPVQVGEGGPTLQTNGEIIDDGVEVLSSMPADQRIERTTDAGSDDTR
jgi:hypothetical protein